MIKNSTNAPMPFYIFMSINTIMAAANRNPAALFRALGDETRFNLVAALSDGERCACKLPSIVKRAQPTVSLQLKYLVNAGVLSARRDGRKIFYKISDKRVLRLLKTAKGGKQ